MARSLYITAMGPSSGKSVVTLGLMDLLTRRVGRVAFFRPVVRTDGGPDNDVELLRSRYLPDAPYDACFALSSEQMRTMTGSGGAAGLESALKRVLAAFKVLEARYDFVLCEGTDFTGVSAPLEFEFNAQVAGHLGTPVLVVVSGASRPVDQVREAVSLAVESLTAQGVSLVGVIVNRADADTVGELRRELELHPTRVPVDVIPDQPLLRSPTLGELVEALGARHLTGDPQELDRVVRSVKVAAMTVPNLLDHITDDTLLVTPGDRADVVTAAQLLAQAPLLPQPSGVVLTGGLDPSPALLRVFDGLPSKRLALLAVEGDTYETAVAITGVESRVRPGDDLKIAAALGAFDDHVDTARMEERIDVVRSTRVTPLMFEYELIERARADRRHVVLPEGDDDRILQATDRLVRRGVADLTLLGKERLVRRRAAELGLDLSSVEVIDPATSPWLDDFTATYYELRRHKGVTEELAHDIMTDVSYFGTMMVHKGRADAMVSGAAHSTAHRIRPALEFVKTRPGVQIVSSVFFMCLADRVLVYGDCAVNPDPTAEQLADIAITSAATAAQFGIEPYIAMLSYSTGTSGEGADVDKVREATAIAHERAPHLKIEGPIQYDAAIDASVAATKLPGSEVAGHATVFVFPDLNTGNNTYKAVQRSAGAVAIGPVLQGLRRPVNDLSRGATVADIVNTVAITAVQAQGLEV